MKSNTLYLNSNLCKKLEIQARRLNLPLPLLDKECTESKNLLGCGAYGCVYETEENSILFKETSDQDEAKFAAIYLNLSQNNIIPGIVKYYGVFHIASRQINEEINRYYILWRERAEHVGEALTELAVSSEADIQIVKEYDILRNDYTLTLALQLSIMLDTLETSAANKQEFLNYLMYIYDRYKYKIAMQEYQDSSEKLCDTMLKVYKFLLIKEPEFIYLKNILSCIKYFARQAIFLQDIRNANLGLINSKPVITDPSVPVIINPKFYKIAIENL